MSDLPTREARQVHVGIADPTIPPVGEDHAKPEAPPREPGARLEDRRLEGK